MSLLQVKDLAKSFGIKEIFKNVSFNLNKGSRIGIIGANGAGKTTLMQCIMGREDYDAGNVKLDSTDIIGYVEQTAEFTALTLHDELLLAFAEILTLEKRKAKLEKKIAATPHQDEAQPLMSEYSFVCEEFERLGGYDYESRLRRISFGLGFTEADFTKSPQEFSGGQMTRIRLAKALMREPDFLFLDEPTNHLDIEMIEWLENFLREYRGGVLLISHDRFFLDRVTTAIIELIDQTIDLYDGNYTKAMHTRNEKRAALQSAFIKQQAYIKKTEEYIRKYKAGIKAKQARGRETRLKRLQRIVLPPDAAGFNYFLFNPPAECAKRVLEIDDLSFSYGKENVLDEVSLTVTKGDGVAIVGLNGAGKTTLLKLIIGELQASGGTIKLGNRVKLGYFSQNHEELNGSNTVLREITDHYGANDEQARGYLGAFLFKGEDVEQRVCDLSGGEKTRLALLKLMMDGANFIILDEPTNHLDIPAREAVERALMSFPGTFLVVSHDRYFLDKITNDTCEIIDGSIVQYDGNYSYYREQKLLQAEVAAKQAQEQPKVQTAAKVGKEKTAAPPPTKEKKSIFANPDKKRESLQRCEAELAMLEVELKALEQVMNDPLTQNDPEKSAAIALEYSAKQAAIDKKYDQWAELTE